MALFSAIGGSKRRVLRGAGAGLITLLLVYRLARVVRSRRALLATALVAWNPVFMAYAKQPMSDVPATMWIVLAICLAIRSTRRARWRRPGRGRGGDHAAGVVLAAAVIPCHPAKRFAATACRAQRAGLAIRLLQMMIQHYLFGSPFSTGYGIRSPVLPQSHHHEPRHLREAWLVRGRAVVDPRPDRRLVRSRGRSRDRSRLSIFCAVVIPYLFYLPFDHWETLRYLFPGMVPVTVTVADGLMHFARRRDITGARPCSRCASQPIAVRN